MLCLVINTVRVGTSFVWGGRELKTENTKWDRFSGCWNGMRLMLYVFYIFILCAFIFHSVIFIFWVCPLLWQILYKQDMVPENSGLVLQVNMIKKITYTSIPPLPKYMIYVLL